MTPHDYVAHVQRLVDQRAYAEVLNFVEEFGPSVDDQLTAEQVRVLRVRLKHAEMVLAAESVVTAEAVRSA